MEGVEKEEVYDSLDFDEEGECVGDNMVEYYLDKGFILSIDFNAIPLVVDVNEREKDMSNKIYDQLNKELDRLSIGGVERSSNLENTYYVYVKDIKE